MMSTCVEPMAANKVIAVIPESRLIAYAKEMEENPAHYKGMLDLLGTQFLTMYRGLGGCSSSTTFQTISAAGVMTKIFLSNHMQDNLVLRFMDLLVMFHMYNLHNEVRGGPIEVVVGPGVGDWTLDFKTGWVSTNNVKERAD